MDFSFLNGVDTINLIVYLLMGSGGLLASIASSVSLFLQRKNFERKKTKDKNFNEGMLHTSVFSGLMNEAREKYGVSHAILFSGHNHGGVPKVGKPFFLSAHQCSVPRLEMLPEGAQRVRDINGVPIDSNQDDMGMLMRIANERQLFLKVGDYPGSTIDLYFQSHNVKEYYIEFIDIVDNALYFLCFAKDGGINKDDVKKMNITIKQVKAKFKEYT